MKSWMLLMVRHGHSVTPDKAQESDLVSLALWGMNLESKHQQATAYKSSQLLSHVCCQCDFFCACV